MTAFEPGSRVWVAGKTKGRVLDVDEVHYWAQAPKWGVPVDIKNPAGLARVNYVHKDLLTLRVKKTESTVSAGTWPPINTTGPKNLAQFLDNITVPWPQEHETKTPGVGVTHHSPNMSTAETVLPGCGIRQRHSRHTLGVYQVCPGS